VDRSCSSLPLFLFAHLELAYFLFFSVLLLLLCGQKCGKNGGNVGEVESLAMAFVLIEMFLLLRWLLLLLLQQTAAASLF